MRPLSIPARSSREALGRVSPCCFPPGSPSTRKARCAWISCDRWDYDEVRLWTSIASAIDNLEPGSTADTLDVLLEDPDSIEDAVASLVNELATRPGPMWLILDDLHVVPSAALGGLATFVERLPPGLHVVIASRIDPMLPLQRWRARGQLGEIRDADLRLGETRRCTVDDKLWIEPVRRRHQHPHRPH